MHIVNYSTVIDMLEDIMIGFSRSNTLTNPRLSSSLMAGLPYQYQERHKAAARRNRKQYAGGFGRCLRR